MKILLTGVTGFLGQYILRNLVNKGYEIVAIVRQKQEEKKNVKWIVGDLKNIDSFITEIQGQQINCCVHLAWEGIPEYSYSKCKESLLMGMNILNICELVKINHLVVSGSCCEYHNPLGKIDEGWPLEEQDNYATSKNALRFMMRSFCKEKKIQLNWLRLFYVIGVGQRETSLIPYSIKELRKGKVPVIKRMGNANDFIDVEDVAEAFAQVIQIKPELEILNVGAGKAISVKEILEIIAKIRGQKLFLEENKEDNYISFFADIETITNKTKWQPLIPLEKTIKKMVIYYDEQGEK